MYMLMDHVDTSILHVDGYFSEVLSCTIMTHLDDLEIKVIDLKNVLKFWVTDFITLLLLNIKLDQIETGRYSSEV